MRLFDYGLVHPIRVRYVPQSGLPTSKQEYTFHPGQVHVINATHRHMTYAFNRASFFNVHFHPDLLNDPAFQSLEDTAHSPSVAGAQYFTPLLPIGDTRTEQVIALLRAIEAERRAGDSAWRLMVKGLILQTVALLARYSISPHPPAAATLRRETLLTRLAPALQLLEQRLADPPSVTELAAATSLSRYHFGELFREALGSSPVAYHNARRPALARRTLTEGQEPIAQITEQVGFATVQQFNHIFRQTMGCPPRHYRDRATGNPDSYRPTLSTNIP